MKHRLRTAVIHSCGALAIAAQATHTCHFTVPQQGVSTVCTFRNLVKSAWKPRIRVSAAIISALAVCAAIISALAVCTGGP